jgi:hypothetical protein
MWIVWTNHALYNKDIDINIHCHKIANTKRLAIVKAKSISNLDILELLIEESSPNITFDKFLRDKKIYVSEIKSRNKQQPFLYVLEIICNRKHEHVIKYNMHIAEKLEITFNYDFEKMKQIIKLNAIKINSIYQNDLDFEYLMAVLLNKFTITISDDLDNYKFVLYSFDIAEEM